MNYSQLLWDCWAYGASYLPFCGLPTWAAAFLPQLGAGEVIPMGTRKFRVLQKLGEGGYAVVYLVSELATEDHHHPDPELRALKRVLVQSSEHFDAVQQEMLVHSAVQHHPNILPLLDYCCSEAGGSGGGATAATAAAAAAMAPALMPPIQQPPPPLYGVGGAVGGGAAGGAVVTVGGGAAGGPAGGSQSRMACFLFPAFRDGTLAAELERLATAATAAGSGNGDGGGFPRLATADVLSVFTQLAKATAHIHAHGYAHRDIKPLNVLISANRDHQTAVAQRQQQRAGRTAGCLGPANRDAHPADVEAGVALTGAAETPAGADVGPRYRCVLMDFGSARPRLVRVASRAQARQLQEDAEAHCSAPYRAPELFDVDAPPSSSASSSSAAAAAPALDFAASDVWALGATLFHVMYGEPPFQRAMNASGGSLALAVLNCAIGWPRPPAPAYPPELHLLVTAAMEHEPAARPSAAQLAEMAEALAPRGLPDPLPQTATKATALLPPKR